MRVARVPRTLCACTALVLSAVTSAFAQNADTGINYAIGVHDGALDVRAAWTLAISGQWPTQCPPTLEKVTLDNTTSNGADLRIDARSVLGLCPRHPMPFAIEVNPALAMDRTALPAGIYHVSFYAADGAQAQPKLRAFALVDRNAASAAGIEPETGFWWTANASAENRSDASGTVLSLELQNGQLSIALMSYDTFGQPVWRFGAAPYGGNIAHVPLVRLQGGADPFSAANSTPHGESTLTLDLQFQSAAHASGWLSRVRDEDASLQLQALDLVRLPLAEVSDGRAWQGDWVLVSDAPDALPRRLRFEQYRALDPANFQLTDTAANVALTCTRNPAQPDWPPASCSLRQGDALAGLAVFSSVALTRMDGQRSDSAGVHLLRVTR